MRRLRDRLKLNNSGVGLVMVIVAIGMILILVTVLMSISLLNYRMKITEKNSKENFYDAEQVLDEIHAGLEQVVSDAAGNAYTQAMQSYTYAADNNKESARILEFRNAYLSYLINALKGDSTDVYEVGGPEKDSEGNLTTDYDSESGLYTSGLCQYLSKELTAELNSGKLVVKYNNRNASGKKAMDTTTDGLILRDLCVQYTDDDGYYSEIQTDIMIGYPTISLTSGGSVPSYFDYAIIADKGIVFGVENGSYNDYTVAASVSAGEDGITISNTNHTISFDKSGGMTPTIVSRGPITVNYLSNLSVVAIQVWCTDISVTGATTDIAGSEEASDASKYSTSLSLNADTYVNDDLTLKGKYISVEISGNYYGYGSGNPVTLSGSDETTTSSGGDYRSAIILNCANSILTLTDKLESLMLEGNAYISSGSVTYKNTTSTSTTETKDNVNTGDVVLGSSLASRIDQVAFLVPAECLGSYEDSTTKKTVAFTNPMTADEYEKWKLNVNKKIDVDIVTNVVGKKLNVYGLYNDDYKAYCRTSTNGETLWYLYLNFDGKEDYAAEYYKAYMKAAETKIESYLKSYDNKIEIKSNALSTETRGDILTYTYTEGDGDNPNGTMDITDGNYYSSGTENQKNLEDRISEYQKNYKAMMAKLNANYNLLSDSEKTKTAYQNLVNTTELEKLDETRIYTNTAGSYAIVANNVNGDAIVVGDKSNGTEAYKNCCLVIASGNVTVKGSFSGTILAGGTVTIDTGDGGTITSNQNNSGELLQSKTLVDSVGTTETLDYAIAQEFLINGENYLIAGSAGGGSAAYVDLESIISYVNWNKY